ncbi:MAG: hypothetical protein COV31_00390 [Candidatus Yanofskybacteria bacterium CG10_big_fil_rev_8_21_14_0_10_46_23]|uniref:Uncharacterized protein n=1 Tax=Candidatus Yanofskybacteria bacterium CG10_big_fil_rev_8_21_14_0_10_46_23 TaxID=1975098 RepID=A0A2H0R6A0_9BACT|nr:MAG: hypothetical protein COV31_00390 [Candidatus Yanofskybacteria bacterium CG10_big_fil_rev_8_21_14_0_10_46_23]
MPYFFKSLFSLSVSRERKYSAVREGGSFQVSTFFPHRNTLSSRVNSKGGGGGVSFSARDNPQKEQTSASLKTRTGI